MTFSRPGFGSASIQPGTNRGNVPTISVPSNTTVTPNAQLRLDGNAPTTLANNELKRGQEIQNFLNFFTDDKKGLIKFGQDEIVRSADREVAAAVEQYGPDFLSSTNATEEMRDAYVSMSPKAKESVIQQQGFSAATRYQGLLEAEMARPEIQGALTRPGNDPETVEARSLAQSQAQQRALEAAGFPNSYQQMQYAEPVGRANGLVTSEYYKKRMNRAANASQMQLVESGVDAIDASFNELEKRVAENPEDPPSSAVAVINSLAEIIPGLETYTPEVAAQVMATAVIGGIMEGTDESRKYARLAAFEQFFGKSDILYPGTNENLAEIPLGGAFGNLTLKQWLDGNEQKLGAAQDTDLLADIKLKISELYRKNPTGVAYDLALQLVQTTPFQDPENRVLADTYVHQVAGRVDPNMAANDRAMNIRIQETGLTPALADEIEKGNYSPEFKNLISQNRNNPAFTDPTTGRVMDVMESDYAVKDIVDAGFGDIKDTTDGGTGYSSFVSEEDRQMMLEARKQNGEKPGIYEQRLEATYKQEVISRAVQALEADAAAQGELTEREAVQQAIQEINQERKRESGGGGPVVSPKDRMVSYSNKTREEMGISIGGNNGQLVITEEMVQPGKMKKWKSNNPGVDFNELSENKKRDVLLKGIQRLEKYDETMGGFRRFTEDEAVELFDELKKQAEEGAAPGQSGQSGGGAKGFTLRTPGVFAGQEERQRRYEQEQEQMRLPVDDDAAPVPPLMRRTLETLEKVTPWLQDALTVPAEQQKGDPPALKKLKQWYNNSGNGGSTPVAILGGFLDLISGASPASAGELENSSPDSLAAMTASWQQGTQGLETAPLPQVAAATPTRYVPSAIATDKHETFVMIGVAEGTRTAGGGYTRHYYGHRDQGDGNNNRGTVSGGRGNSLSPRQIDQKWMRILTSRTQQATPVLRAAGLEPGTAGWNRVMFNVLDLSVQSPAAVPDFLAKLGQVRRQRFTVEAIAKARADSFFSPNSGRLDAPGFGNSYQRLFKDQRQRAGVFDFRRRL